MPLVLAFVAGGLVGTTITLTGSATVDRLLKTVAIVSVGYYVIKGRK